MNKPKSEAQEQMELVEYLETLQKLGRPVLFTAIPNSTFTTSWNQKRTNTQLGLRPGLPDIFLILKGRPVFIEMKRTKMSKISQEQEVWLSAINETESGLMAYVCRGFAEAKKVVDTYLEGI